jgi:hypothetical protein
MSKGTFICYEPKRFSKAHQDVIDSCNHVLDEYAEQGFSLTVRQLFYQGVARGWWENSQTQYNRIVNIVNNGRMAGLISWTAIEDRGRNLMGLESMTGPADAIKRAAEAFRLDLWATQPWRPEVWVEKQALEGVIGEICNTLRVDFYATKGYNSQSEQWRAGRRFKRYIEAGQRPIVFHLGDHDPSGIDMTRDNQERLSLFCGVPVTVMRLALNMNQVEQYAPPPNPLKIRADGEYSDSRAAAYVDQFGVSSWELDALSPRIISDLIEGAILQIRDEALWDEAMTEETNDHLILEDMIQQFSGSAPEVDE